jgi:hypothetical protein
MSIQALQSLVSKQFTTVDVAGQVFRLRKFSAHDGIALVKLFEAMGYGGDGGPDDSPERLAELHRFAATNSVVDDSGSKCLDNEHGQLLLSQLTLPELVALGEHSLKWNGWDASEGVDAKKNSPMTTDSTTCSAEHSRHDTETPKNS